MNNRKELNEYLDRLETRLDDEQAANLFRQLPGVIEHIIALAGPVSGSTGSSSTSHQFKCPRCNKTLTVT